MTVDGLTYTIEIDRVPGHVQASACSGAQSETFITAEGRSTTACLMAKATLAPGDA